MHVLSEWNHMNDNNTTTTSPSLSLGHHMTPEGVTPMQNKINAVLKMGRPTNQTETRLFIGAVIFYKSMWPRRSHVLATLHELTGVSCFIWGSRQEQAFLTMKAMIAADAMSYYSDLNKPFEIYTDASVITWVLLSSRMDTLLLIGVKLSDIQKGYHTTEKEWMNGEFKIWGLIFTLFSRAFIFTFLCTNTGTKT